MTKTNKVLKLNYEGTEYTLEFNRRTVQQMEMEGFVPAEVGDKPMTLVPKLVQGAFRMHHRTLMPALIDEIYKSIPNKDKFIDKLVEMYMYPIESLLDEPEEDSEKNVSWEANW